MSIKTSIIIPTFRRPYLLIKCISEILKQTSPSEEYELIIVTDGPDEETRKKVASFTELHSLSNLYCIALPVKAGPAAARNKGAYIANGELLVFTDDDCLPQPGWLESYRQAYYREKKMKVVFTGKTIVPVSNNPTDYEKNISNLESAEFITANCAASREAFQTVQGFDEEFPIAWREDSEFHFKVLSMNIPILKVDTAVVLHPVRKAPWGISLLEQKKSKYNALLYKKHPYLYKVKIGVKPLLNYYAIVILTAIIMVSIMAKKPTIIIVSALCWCFLIGHFISKRLRGTSKTINHVTEMVITSVLIPFLSVFWTLRGSLIYKKLLL